MAKSLLGWDTFQRFPMGFSGIMWVQCWSWYRFSKWTKIHRLQQMRRFSILKKPLWVCRDNKLSCSGLSGGCSSQRHSSGVANGLLIAPAQWPRERLPHVVQGLPNLTPRPPIAQDIDHSAGSQIFFYLVNLKMFFLFLNLWLCPKSDFILTCLLRRAFYFLYKFKCFKLSFQGSPPTHIHTHTPHFSVAYYEGKLGHTMKGCITADPSECPHSVVSSFRLLKLYLPSIYNTTRSGEQITCKQCFGTGIIAQS